MSRKPLEISTFGNQESNVISSNYISSQIVFFLSFTSYIINKHIPRNREEIKVIKQRVRKYYRGKNN